MLNSERGLWYYGRSLSNRIVRFESNLEASQVPTVSSHQCSWCLVAVVDRYYSGESSAVFVKLYMGFPASYPSNVANVVFFWTVLFRRFSCRSSLYLYFFVFFREKICFCIDVNSHALQPRQLCWEPQWQVVSRLNHS